MTADKCRTCAQSCRFLSFKPVKICHLGMARSNARTARLLETGPNHDESRDEVTGYKQGLCMQSADFIPKTTEQSFAVPEALAFYVGYYARKTVNFYRHLPTTTLKVFLHETYTGKNCTILSIYINRLFKSKDLERVKGIELGVESPDNACY